MADPFWAIGVHQSLECWGKAVGTLRKTDNLSCLFLLACINDGNHMVMMIRKWENVEKGTEIK